MLQCGHRFITSPFIIPADWTDEPAWQIAVYQLPAREFATECVTGILLRTLAKFKGDGARLSVAIRHPAQS